MKQLILTITFGLFQPCKTIKSFVTCFQYSNSISLHFPYDLVYLPDGCEASAITLVLPSNKRLNVNPMIKTMENKLGFSRSYSKISTFSLMQCLDISSTSDETLKSIANKIPEMKCVSVQHKQYLNKT